MLNFRKSIARFLLLISMLTTCSLAQKPAVRVQYWHEDLQVLKTELPKLDAALQSSPQAAEAFRTGISSLDSQIAGMTDNQIIAGTMKIMAALGVAHDTVVFFDSGLHGFPLRLQWFPDGYHVVGAPKDHPEILGARLLKIDQVSAEEASARLAPLISHENSYWLRFLTPLYLTIAEPLNGAGITAEPNRAIFTFETSSGPKTVTLVAGADAIADNLARLPATALFRKNPETIYWFEYLPDSKTLYFSYRRCSEMPQRPFAAFNEDLQHFLDTHSVDRVVVDLRGNTGGNSAVLGPFIKSMAQRKEFAHPGRLFVVIGRAVLSSSMMNAVDLKLKDHAILVGEPTGGKPNQFGLVQSLELPHSHLKIQYSKRYWKIWPVDSDLALKPDISAEETWQDYIAGKDAALNAILRQKP